MLDAIKELSKKIEQLKLADEAYESSESSMSDEAYDKLREVAIVELNSIDKKQLSKEALSIILEADKYLNSMRNSINIAYKKNKVYGSLLAPAKDLKKIYNLHDFLVFMRNEIGNSGSVYKMFYLEPKFDGVNLNLIYKEGRINSALTRGNGYQGEDILSLLEGVRSIPKIINWEGDVQITGELIMSYESLKEFNTINNKAYKTPRSAVVALMKSNDMIQMAKYVDFLPHSKFANNKLEKMLFGIRENGFLEQRIELLRSEDLKDIIHSLEAKEKTIVDITKCKLYPIDGLVVTYSLNCKSVAIKPKITNYLVTTIKEAKWNITEKTGKLTCTLMIDTITVDNKEYSKLPIRDLSLIDKGELKIGKKITVSVENELLNYDYAVNDAEAITAKAIERPIVCPRCSQLLTNKGSDYYCENKKCLASLMASFCKMNKVLDISLSNKIIEEAINEGADNLYKYLKRIIEAVELTKTSIKEVEFSDILGVFNIVGFTSSDYIKLANILNEINETTNVEAMQNKVHALGRKKIDVRNFKKKMFIYYDFCESNHLWLDDFFALVEAVRRG